MLDIETKRAKDPHGAPRSSFHMCDSPHCTRCHASRYVPAVHERLRTTAHLHFIGVTVVLLALAAHLKRHMVVPLGLHILVQDLHGHNGEPIISVVW